MRFVLDSSVALAWTLPDGEIRELDSLFDCLSDHSALVPPVWPLEIGSVLRVAVKRERLIIKDVTQLVSELRTLPLEIDGHSNEQALKDTLSIAKKYQLTTITPLTLNWLNCGICH